MEWLLRDKKDYFFIKITSPLFFVSYLASPYAGRPAPVIAANSVRRDGHRIRWRGGASKAIRQIRRGQRRRRHERRAWRTNDDGPTSMHGQPQPQSPARATRDACNEPELLDTDHGTKDSTLTRERATGAARRTGWLREGDAERERKVSTASNSSHVELTSHTKPISSFPRLCRCRSLLNTSAPARPVSWLCAEAHRQRRPQVKVTQDACNNEHGTNGRDGMTRKGMGRSRPAA